jgi:hypothetical protein
MTCTCRKNQLHRVQNHFQQDVNVTRKFENYGIVASTGEPLIVIRFTRTKHCKSQCRMVMKTMISKSNVSLRGHELTFAGRCFYFIM